MQLLLSIVEQGRAHPNCNNQDCFQYNRHLDFFVYIHDQNNKIKIEKYAFYYTALYLLNICNCNKRQQKTVNYQIYIRLFLELERII